MSRGTLSTGASSAGEDGVASSVEPKRPCGRPVKGRVRMPFVIDPDLAELLAGKPGRSDLVNRLLRAELTDPRVKKG